MVTWYDAVRYCRWLTEQEGLPESQQCYPKDVGPNMKVPDDFLERRGYRLPTEAEWESSCRAGTSTRRFFGDDDSALSDYDWFNKNSDDHLWPVGLKKPNPLGLFDLYGNCCEWCQECDRCRWTPGETRRRFELGGSNRSAVTSSESAAGPTVPRSVSSARRFPTWDHASRD